jgi:hypothetical protein
MSRKINVLLSVITVIAILGTMLLILRSHEAQAAPGVPNTPDAKQIMALMDKAYQILGHASQAFDVSEFPAVFIDTEDYKLTDQQREAVANVLGETVADNAGYLTAMQAQYISRGQGAKSLQAALDKAKAENRELTADEFQEIVTANHGQVPSLGSPITAKTVLTYESIQINGDKAIVRYDDGAASQEAILVKVNGRWLIASITPIWIHF